MQQILSTRQDDSILTNDGSRYQAYGWSLPSQNHLKVSNINGKSQVNVPVPVYCQPMFNTNDKTQVKENFYCQ